MNRERWEIKFRECPHCSAKQPVGYIWEYQLRSKHICGSCQIGELLPTDLRKLEMINGKYV